jgi:Domain of unknown function (DUF4864)
MRHFLALVISLFMLGTALAAEPTADQKSAMQAVVGAQLDAFAAGRHDDAFSHAAPSIQALFGDVNNFITMVQKGFAPVYSHKSYNFGTSFSENGRFAQRVVIDGQDGKRYEALYTLQQQADGSWKITSCTLLEIASEGV